MQKSQPISFKMIRSFFIDPLTEQKGRITYVFIALLLLSSSQSLLLLLLGPFLKTLLGLGHQQLFVGLDDLLPSRTFEFFPHLRMLQFSKEILVVGIPCLLLGAAWIRNIAMFFYQLNTAAIALFIAKNYRDRLFVKLMSRPFSYLVKKTPAQWMSYLMNDVLYLQTRFSDILNSFVRDGCVVLAAFASLLFIHLPTGLFLLSVSPFIAFGMGRTGKKIAFFAEVFQSELANMADLVLEIRRRFEFIRAQGGEKRDFNRFSSVNNSYYRFIKRSLFVRAFFAPSMEFIGFFLFSAILLGYGQGLIAQDFSADNLIVFFGALGLVFKPLRNLGEQIAKFQETKGSLSRSFEVLLDQTKGSFLDSPTDESISELPSSINIKSVAISYDESEGGFFGNDLKLDRGKSIAIVGPSGSGKSTLLKSLAGLLRPDTWDSCVSWQQLRKHVSMVSQAPFLFQETLKANLLYGNRRRDLIGEREIWQALDVACATEVVQRLQDRLGYEVSTVTKNLSGGQIQRLVIARALLRGQSIWLFDEATSALDFRMEEKLLTQLVEQCKLKKNFFLAVTHRLQFIHLFDEIWFVEKGRLIAIGTHERLMENSRYRLFYGASTTGL